jgi:hypothetical protein
MALIDALDKGSQALARFRDHLRAVAAAARAPASGTDQSEAAAVRRGLRPELVEAYRKALGLKK